MKAAALAVVVMACGDNTHNVVTVNAGFVTEFAYRDGDGAWTRLPPNNDTLEYQFEVADDFEVVTVNDLSTLFGSPSFFVGELAGTYTESSQWHVVGTGPFVPSSCGTFPQNTFHIGAEADGTMVQHGQVSVSINCQASDTPAWSFSISAEPGLHDLIATDPVDAPMQRIAIERGQLLGPATTVPTIDLDASGVALAPIEVTIVNPEETTTSVEVDLYTATDAAVVHQGGGILDPPKMRTTPALVVPPSALLPTDLQVLTIHSPAPINADRAASTVITEASDLALELIPPPAVEFVSGTDTDAVTWAAAPASVYTGLTLLLQDSSHENQQAITASKGWLELHDAAHLEFDTSAPGFAVWQLDRTQSYQRLFTVTDASTPTTYWTTVTSEAPPIAH